MPQDIHATGFMGLAFEATAGTFVAPTKFFPIRSEGLSFSQGTIWRRNIRGIADVQGAVSGFITVAGDITMECLESVLPYFLYASRNTVAKTGTTNFVYTTTPKHNALPTTGRTLSLTIVRNGEAFAYTGCVTSGISFTVEDGLLMMTISIVGRDEATASLPTPTYDTTVPFGAGQYDIEIPTGTDVTDSDSFTFSFNDNATGENRLKTTRSLAFVRFGEREATLSLTRDYDGRADYDAFKALTSQSITILATKGTNNQVQFLLPVSIKNTYEISGLGSQGDLVRATINYNVVYDTGTSKAYEIICKTQESIT